MKVCLKDSPTNWTKLRKESTTLKICPQKLPKLKRKRKKNGEKNELWDNYNRYNICDVQQNARGGDGEKRTEEIFEVTYG